MRKSTVVLLLTVAILALAACSAAPEATPYPTYTPYPEPTPYPTYTPYPAPTPYPTYTPYPEPEAAMSDLTDLFCAYDFCIGHPAGAYLTDLDAPDAWNDYDFGVLIGVNTTGSWMAVDWERAGRSEWQTEGQALDAANSLGEAQGEVRMEQVGAFDVAVVASYDEADEALSYGSAAAWYCGGRGFRAAVFNKTQALPELLLLEAIERFTCGE
ncbi:MAG: hypothetical protein WA040_00260 [Anaerolineae bacterium]